MQRNVINTTENDHMYFRDIIMPYHKSLNYNSSPVNKMLCEDIFYALYKMSPEVVGEEEIYPSYLTNHSFVKNFVESPEYQSLHQQTQLDEVLSQDISEEFTNEILKKLDKESQEFNDDLSKQEQELEDLKEQADGLDDVMNEFQDQMTDEQKEELKKKLDEMRKQQQEMEGEIQEKREDIRQALTANGIEIFRTVNNLAKEKSEEIKEAVQLSSSCGIEDATNEKVSLQERLELARRIKNNDKLKKIVEVMGRMRRIARGVKKSTGEPEQITNVITGNDLTNVLPSELALLNVGLGDLFNKKYSDANLLQYEKKDNVVKGTGPIIILIDESGSMSMWNREIYAKAISLAVMDICKREDRDLTIVPFSSSLGKRYTFPKGKFSKNAFLDFATTFMGGGTDYEPPLKAGLKIIQESEYKDADILFLSDDECFVPDSLINQLKKSKEEDKLRIMGILIGNGRQSQVLPQFCDVVISGMEIEGNDGIAEEIYKWFMLK